MTHRPHGSARRAALTIAAVSGATLLIGGMRALKAQTPTARSGDTAQVAVATDAPPRP